MATALTEVDTFTASVVVPDPGDSRNAASVNTPFQALANRTKHLFALLNARLGGRALNGHAFTFSTGFARTGGTGSNLLASSDSVSAQACIDSLLVPGCTITAVAMEVTPGVARPTVGDRISLTLYKVPTLSTGAETPLGSNTDDGTTTPQSITVSVSEVVDLANYSYVVSVKAGADASTHVDLIWGAGRVTIA